jgi:diguanylate cyclase (GGDEF)-like protein/PAS domain S-box-containing protein
MSVVRRTAHRAVCDDGVGCDCEGPGLIGEIGRCALRYARSRSSGLSRRDELPISTSMGPAANTTAARRGGVLSPGSAPELLKALTAHTPVGVFVSSGEGACVYVNERWCELTGLSGSEALGDGWSATLHPDDSERVAAEWAAASAEGRDSVVEYRFLRPDGSVTWVKGYASAVYGPEGLLGWVGSLLELTEYRAAVEALTTERETFRAAFDDAPIGMALVAPSGRFLRVNSALCEIVDYSEAELLGMSFQDITHADDLDADVELVRQLLRGEIGSYLLEKRYLRPDGSAYWAEISVSLIRDNRGEPLHFVVHVEDINERKLAERRLRREADHDPLTGLLNRRRLLEELESTIAKARRHGTTADLILLDLDRFKTVNDRLGHAAGDRVLVAAAQALRHRLRKSDILARLGGDEFAAIIETDGAPASGERIARELLAAVRAGEPATDTSPISLTASAGIVAIAAGTTAAAALDAADQALYRAKDAGRNRTVRYPRHPHR